MLDVCISELFERVEELFNSIVQHARRLPVQASCDSVNPEGQFVVLEHWNLFYES